MNKSSSRYINGTAALDPACSRYRNENERIISFEAAAQHYDEIHGTHYESKTRIRRARNQHKTFSETLSLSVSNLPLVKDFQSGNIWGRSLSPEEALRVKSFGLIYTLAALATIALSSL